MSSGSRGVFKAYPNHDIIYDYPPPKTLSLKFLQSPLPFSPPTDLTTEPQEPPPTPTSQQPPNDPLNTQQSQESLKNSQKSLKVSSEPKIPLDTSPQPQTAKKYQKIKHEIDLQNYEVAKLTRELKMRTERCFPPNCLQQTETKLCNAQKRLRKMIKCAMEEQKKSGGENWGPIPMAFDESFPDKDIIRPKTPSNLSEISGFSKIHFSEIQLDDYENLEADRYSLQREILNKDAALNDLERKLETTQSQLLKMCQENQLMTQKLKESQGTCQKDLNTKLTTHVEKATKLSCSIEKLSSNLGHLRSELDGLKNEKKIAFDLNESEKRRPKTSTCPTDDARKLKHLESQYTNLQIEYCQREKQYIEMMDRMKGLLDKCDDDRERAVNEALKTRADEMVNEINDNKVFIKELQEQVENYREKFLKGERLE